MRGVVDVVMIRMKSTREGNGQIKEMVGGKRWAERKEKRKEARRYIFGERRRQVFEGKEVAAFTREIVPLSQTFSFLIFNSL